jgi:hypothetical protein
MSFEIVPNSSLANFSVPTEFTEKAVNAYGVERFVAGSYTNNGRFIWTTNPTTTWTTSPSNSSGSGFQETDHWFDVYAYANTGKILYTTGRNQVVNTPYLTKKISYASLSSLRPDGTQANISLTKCSGSFPVGIRPLTIACTPDGMNIIVAADNNIMISKDSAASWSAYAIPDGIAYGFLPSVIHDGSDFYIIWSNKIYKTDSALSGTWTLMSTITTFGISAGASKLKVFNIDDRNTKLYMCSYGYNSAGNKAGIVVSSDAINWTAVSFDAIVPVDLITDFSFASRVGNKLVVVVNNNNFGSNNNGRYVFYTSDLTGKTGWTYVTDPLFNKNDYYDLQSVCVTSDNVYYVFDRLGGIYYSTNLTSWTKATNGAGLGLYDLKVFLIDGREFVNSAYGNAALDEANTYSSSATPYANDVHSTGSSYLAQKWTKQNLTFTSIDDGYSNEAINLGFDWGYSDTTYNTFRLNTNGQLQFNQFDGETSPLLYPNRRDMIVAHSGDLWLDPGSNNSTSPTSWPSISTSTDVTISTLNSTYKIQVTSNNAISLIFKLDANAAPQYSRYITILGFTGTNGTFYTTNDSGVIDFEGFTTNANYLAVSSIASIRISYLNSYQQYLKSQIPEYGLPDYRSSFINNNKQSIWTKNISWLDGGVQHHIFRMVVHCSSYNFFTTDYGYKISLYKAGSSQRISISTAHNWSAIDHSQNTKKCGPWPAVGLTPSKGAPLNYNETSWYSDDNGSTWYLNNTFSTTKSSVVQMGPPLGVTSNISLNTLNPYLKNNRTIRYSATATWPNTFRSNKFGYAYPNEYNVRCGINMWSILKKYIEGGSAADSNETSLFAIFNTSYDVQINKDTYTYKFSDINKNGTNDSGDWSDLYQLSNGLNPSNSSSYDGEKRLAEVVLATLGEEFAQVAFDRGWIKPKSTSLGGFATSTGYIPNGAKNISSVNVSLGTVSTFGPFHTDDIIYSGKPGYAIPQSTPRYYYV